MGDILDFYQQQAKQVKASETWLAQLQQKALTDFARLGFPSRHQESWKYLAVEPFLKQSFMQAKPGKQLDHDAIAVMATGRQTDAPIGMKIACVDGVVLGLKTIQASLPPGVIVQTLQQAAHDHPEKLKPYLDTILPHQHAFHAMNTAMLHDGLFIYVPKHVTLAEPLLLSHWQTTNNQALYLRHVVVAEPGSSLTIIEDFQGESHACYFTNTITEVYLAANASLVHYKIQRESPLAFHVGHIAVTQEASSQFKSHVLSLGSQWSRSDMNIQFKAPQAHCVLNGIYAPRREQQMGHHTAVQHGVPDCHSQQDYKGILSEQSHAVFQGEVTVGKDATATKAEQQNKNLLLSAGAEIDTKPQLAIFADDVQCTHGATVGQLDEEALFYLTTRGIDKSEARRYLIQAFASANLQALDHEPLRVWMASLLNQQMG